MVASVIAIISLVASTSLMVYDMAANTFSDNIILWVIITVSLGSAFSAIGLV